MKDKTLVMTTEPKQPTVQCIIIALVIKSYKMRYKS